MPLSDHEQQVLDQMERALASEDPKFTSVFTGSRTNPRRTAGAPTTKRSLVAAGVAIVAGIAGLFAGVMAQLPFIGIIGFVVIVGAISVIVTSPRGAQAAPKTKSTKSRASFMQGLEDRWDRRQDH